MLYRPLFALAAAALLTGATAPKAVTTELKGKGYEFDYSYPPVVDQFPKLRAKIDAEKQTQLSELKDMAKGWVEDTPERAQEMPLQTTASWQTVTDLPGYLSLTYDNWSFTGGAHGNSYRSSMVWDKARQSEIAPIAMFKSAAAFDALVQTPYCDKLDIERSKKRDGEKVDRSQSDDWMQACPKPSELVVILGSSTGKQFNRFSVYAAPYAVGPYVEGDYEVDMPITAKLLAAVKPAYRSAFALTPAKAGKRR